MRGWSIPLGRWMGVEMRVHAFFPLLIIVCLGLTANGGILRGLGTAAGAGCIGRTRIQKEHSAGGMGVSQGGGHSGPRSDDRFRQQSGWDTSGTGPWTGCPVGTPGPGAFPDRDHGYGCDRCGGGILFWKNWAVDMEPVADKEPPSLTNSSPEATVSLGTGWQDRVRTTWVDIKAGSPVFPFDGRDPRAAEQYRIVRTKILQHPSPLYIIAISSPQMGDGKSVTAVNVAGALALRNEISVLLVDADFRRSALAGLFDVSAAPGLTEVLSGESPLEEAIMSLQFGATKLYFLSAGRRTKNPAELLGSKQWALVCAEIRKRFDYCIIDTPPVGVVADYDLVQPA